MTTLFLFFLVGALKYFIKYLQTLLWLFLQTDDKTAKNRKLKKEKDETEEKSMKSDQASGLNVSSQVDEYDQDTSDEEVRRLTSVFLIFIKDI